MRGLRLGRVQSTLVARLCLACCRDRRLFCRGLLDYHLRHPGQSHLRRASRRFARESFSDTGLRRTLSFQLLSTRSQTVVQRQGIRESTVSRQPGRPRGSPHLMSTTDLRSCTPTPGMSGKATPRATQSQPQIMILKRSRRSTPRQVSPTGPPAKTTDTPASAKAPGVQLRTRRIQSPQRAERLLRVHREMALLPLLFRHAPRPPRQQARPSLRRESARSPGHRRAVSLGLPGQVTCRV